MKEDLEERLKTIEKQLTGVGKENLENIKDAFENPQEGNKSEREQIVIERSEADKRRVIKTFTQVSYSLLILNVFSAALNFTIKL